jgi:hypothetical protein
VEDKPEKGYGYEKDQYVLSLFASFGRLVRFDKPIERIEAGKLVTETSAYYSFAAR